MAKIYNISLNVKPENGNGRIRVDEYEITENDGQVARWGEYSSFPVKRLEELPTGKFQLYIAVVTLDKEAIPRLSDCLVEIMKANIERFEDSFENFKSWQ